ncbi:MAG: hypothetical protein QG552_38, partial [Thermodesulfobacteriota bacterium]|nr:hypothetical protein [Thermodesulfobacteriota bacterium]
MYPTPFRVIIGDMPPFDVIFVLPYPFADHPSFPEGLLKKALEASGFSVGIIETPSWQKKEAFQGLGRPRLFFAIISGPVDSLVLNYTANRKRRKEDLYQWGGKAFFDGTPLSVAHKIRPDRTVIVFANRLREAFKGVPIVIGGIEASLRLFAHYDFLEDRIRRSILLDSRAAIAVTGMGERQLVALARSCREGIPLEEAALQGTARVCAGPPDGQETVILPSLEEVQHDPVRLLDAQVLIEKARLAGKRLAQGQGGRYIVAEPSEVYSRSDLDSIYGRPYRRSHLDRKALSPALQMNLFSIDTHRGCGGECAFCAIGVHQGKRVISRSRESIVGEAHRLIRHPRWRGFISDLGGPSAEMYGMDCGEGSCVRGSCLFPKVCPRLPPVRSFVELLREIRALSGIQKVFLGSGIRYDLFLNHPDLLKEILLYHVGRFLRIAPEHTQGTVLSLMRKPPFESLKAFVRLFQRVSRGLSRPVELRPYLIVGHPGETPVDVREMASRLKALSLPATDVQIFTPTPGTLATAMYYAEMAPDRRPIPVEKRISALVERKALLT